LVRIDGIARKTAEAMYEIGVHSYSSLAQYLGQRSAQQVSAALQEHGVKRPPALIDPATWGRQARAFCELEDAAPTPPGEVKEPAPTLKEVPTSRDSQEHDAAFTVSFDVATDRDQASVLCTTVCDRTNGGQQGIFEGYDATPWVNWILERAHLPVAVERIAAQKEVTQESPPIGTETATPAAPVELGDARLEISDVQLSELGPTSGVPEKRLKAEIHFQLSGAEAETLASQGIPFRIEGYTTDLESGALELVASDLGCLAPQVLEYRDQQEFRIPDVGRYEYHSIVLLLPPGGVVAYRRGPTVRIVP
jgi:hypothetical protein